jgi:hypothetical protein
MFTCNHAVLCAICVFADLITHNERITMQKILRICTITLCLFLGTTQTSQAQTPSFPRVWSMTANENARSINTITFNVTFSEGVTGVDVSDFVTSGDDQNARIASVLQGSPNDKADTYVVEVTISGPSTHLALTLFDDDSITNTAHIPLGGVGTQNGNAVSAAVTPSYTTEALGEKTTQIRQTILNQLLPRSILHSVGMMSSLSFTGLNVPVISYYDETNGDLKLAVCNDANCLSPFISTLDSSGNVGFSPSLALTSANIPIISYLDVANGDLKLAICNNIACSNPSISTLDSLDYVGAFSSLALTSANIPVISYSDDTNKILKLAVCNDTACASPTISTLTTSHSVGEMTSLALTTANIPVISYYDSTNLVLKLVVCNDGACSLPTISTLDSSGSVGRYMSLALTSTNIPVISYFESFTGALKLVVCNDTTCSVPVVSTLDSSEYTGHASSLALSLALTTANIPVISYHDASNQDLKVAVCHDTACSDRIILTLDSSGNVGENSSLALSIANIPVISYYDQTNGNLKLYHLVSTAIDQGQPNSFGKSSPTAGQSITAATTTLSWAASTHATSYAYCYALSIAACTTWTSAGTATTARISGLAHGATYYWQVRSTNTSGTMLADSGTYRTFRVTLPPAAFAKSSPATNATKQKTSLSLTWAASTRATSYEYCIALTTAACSTWKSTGTARTKAVTGLTKNKTYYWQVRARNTIGTTLSSSTFWKFTTAP